MKRKTHTEGAKQLKQKLVAIHKASNGTLGKTELADKLDVSVSTIDHWVTERRRPTLEQAVALKRLLKISVESWAKTVRA